ncbi:MAG: TonB-dependent receptor, partial [Holophagales bacterium]|nr:TonB-dependent receptor [Holophagales bacterium]
GVDLLESDEFERGRFSVDFNARWQFSDSIQLYLDAINLNDAEDRRFFQGNARSGSIFSQIENYGATYQLGVRVNFEQ